MEDWMNSSPPNRPKVLQTMIVQRRPKMSDTCPIMMKPVVAPMVQTMEKRLEEDGVEPGY